MGEKAKEAATTATKLIDKLPADKREIAARLAETYAAGLATGMELAATESARDAEVRGGKECRKTEAVTGIKGSMLKDFGSATNSVNEKGALSAQQES